MSTDPLALLKSLREEFLAASERSDGHFTRMTLAREPMLKEGGAVDRDILRAIDAAVEDRRELAMDAEWHDNPDAAECLREIVAIRPGEKGLFYLRFEELAAGAIRCLVQIPPAVQAFKLSDVLREDEDWAFDSYWTEVLIRIARMERHPVLRVTEGTLVYGGKNAGLEFFDFGGSTIFLRSPKPGTLTRMKKLAKAKTSCERLQCGILRGSAYAIDWILDKYRPTA
ncbi:MAG TPA: hypothetical protein VHP11_12300 [Tepidisphaeraceae bacterium]|nr:hypothetical protein [Tepidisphaeraceae bacterium]